MGEQIAKVDTMVTRVKQLVAKLELGINGFPTTNAITLIPSISSVYVVAV